MEGEVSSPVAGARGGGGATAAVGGSRVKKALGLKARRSSSSAQPMMARTLSQTSGPASPGRGRRPMTSAEIMRQQMRVTEQSDARLRRTLMRAVVGQVGRRPDTIVLPLELLRQLKPAEFADSEEYHQWQFRQVKLLEAGLILHPSLPLDRLNSAVLRFREVMHATEIRAIDTAKNSDAMRALTNAVQALAWRSGVGSGGGDACHWADGYPLNVLLYVSLLQTVFDQRECTAVLDEVDELLELIKKTWPTLGITKPVHNVCFAWAFFQQYVITSQVEADLAAAALAVLADVAADAKQQGSRDAVYVKVLVSALGAMQEWSERRLLDYHDSYEKGIGGAPTEGMEVLLSLALSAGKIVADRDAAGAAANFAGDRVDYYIRCSMKNAFTKILENGMGDGEPGVVLTELARDTEQLAQIERRSFSPVLRRWHPFPGAVAAVTLHGCFGVVLKQYLGKATGLTNELVHVLHAAGRLEKALVQMVVEDVADSDDGGKSVVREVVPYDVESVVAVFLRTWTEERLRICKECLLRAKETESWMPRSKNEPYAQSAVELMKLAKATVDEFFGIPVSARDDMVQDLADGMEAIFHQYISFLASCGSRQSYLPSLPPLTRCNQDSRIIRLWKRAATPCRVPVSSPRGSVHQGQGSMASGGQNPRPSTSRGTQRLYVRLNTLHFLLSHIHALDKSLSFFSRGRCSSPSSATARLLAPSSHLDRARAAAQSAVGHVAEVAAYRLIFLDSHHSFYDGLYVGGVADARIRPALRTLKQNLSLLLSVVVDRVQPVAVREVMKASFQAFSLVLLAGGSDRSFTKEDHGMVEEDFRSLKRAFCTRGEGLVTEEVVDGEAEAAESVVALMGQTAEQLVEELTIACELSGVNSAGQRMRVPATTWRWSRTDPNTILCVLCHRDDEVASHYLKRTFQLPKRR
ncbi:hypothetical protein E2562_023954 [Oryza meyeriana var. granulata]|uniref:MHD1 domain-containing protein n=1 Tax=Oryza meyeriana var. granulata TaxID=110450 RepID=A0A6G1BZE4_9ORYZ|nr:hypothetical protein E2562_023954 [Oryza meyeriana var. granulata]